MLHSPSSLLCARSNAAFYAFSLNLKPVAFKLSNLLAEFDITGDC